MGEQGARGAGAWVRDWLHTLRVDGLERRRGRRGRARPRGRGAQQLLQHAHRRREGRARRGLPCAARASQTPFRRGAAARQSVKPAPPVYEAAPRAAMQRARPGIFTPAPPPALNAPDSRDGAAVLGLGAPALPSALLAIKVPASGWAAVVRAHLEYPKDAHRPTWCGFTTQRPSARGTPSRGPKHKPLSSLLVSGPDRVFARTTEHGGVTVSVSSNRAEHVQRRLGVRARQPVHQDALQACLGAGGRCGSGRRAWEAPAFLSGRSAPRG